MSIISAMLKTRWLTYDYDYRSEGKQCRLPMSPYADPIRTFPDLVRSLWHPMSDPLKAHLTEASVLLHDDMPFLIVRYLLARICQVLLVYDRRQSPGRSTALRLLVRRKLHANQSAGRRKEF